MTRWMQIRFMSSVATPPGYRCLCLVMKPSFSLSLSRTCPNLLCVWRPPPLALSKPRARSTLLLSSSRHHISSSLIRGAHNAGRKRDGRQPWIATSSKRGLETARMARSSSQPTSNPGKRYGILARPDLRSRQAWSWHSQPPASIFEQGGGHQTAGEESMKYHGWMACMACTSPRNSPS